MMTKIWRAVPIEFQNGSYANRMIALSERFGVLEGRSIYRVPAPETDFEKEVYSVFRNLIRGCSPNRIEYIVPLIKEFVIDNSRGVAIVLFRNQYNFIEDQGFGIKETLFCIKKGGCLRELYTDYAWLMPVNFRCCAVGMSKIYSDPMLYSLKERLIVPKNIDMFGLDLKESKVSFYKEADVPVSIEI